MIKYFCDICGVEVFDEDDFYDIITKEPLYKPSKYNVCEDCAEEIINFIENKCSEHKNKC